MTSSSIPAAVVQFAEATIPEADNAFSEFREIGTITPSGTVGFIERVPGENFLFW